MARIGEMDTELVYNKFKKLQQTTYGTIADEDTRPY